MKKKRCNFTIDEDLWKWFNEYSKKESRTMSSLINSFILELKRNDEEADYWGQKEAKFKGSQKTPLPRRVLKS